MKKSSKVLLSLGMASMCALPLLLTGCNASTQEIGKITISSARNYVEKHQDYENYKDTTYKVNYEMQTKEKYPLSYKKKATDEEYTEGTFTGISSYSNSLTISIKNKDKDDLALYIKMVNTEKENYYDVDEETECLVKTNNKWVGTEEFIVSFEKDEEGNKNYYIVNTRQSVFNGEKSEKEVIYQSIDREGYINYISNIIERTKVCAVNSYFFTSSMMDGGEMMAMFLNYSENNGKVTCSMEAGTPYIGMTGEEIQSMYYYYYISSSYAKSGLDTAKAKMYMYGGETENNAQITLNVSGSASGTFKVPNLENAEEISGSFNPEEDIYIPQSIMDVMGD